MAPVTPNQDTTLPCVFCKSAEVDVNNFGPKYECQGIVTHYYCMLFAAGLHQRAKDGEGILGFLLDDIRKEVRRSGFLKCTFCSEKGASVGCCKKSCRCKYHFNCGLKNNVQYQFSGNFETYCESHYEAQDITIPESDWKCPICLSGIDKSEGPVMATCCRSSVFHKSCLQLSALNSGYFFKCPMCCNSTDFIEESRRWGIFVPEQDASWEKDPNAFGELYFQYSKCDAEKCLCPKGREHAALRGNFVFARCTTCGATGVHRTCGRVEKIDTWTCDGCLSVIKNVESQLEKTLETPHLLSQAGTSSSGIADSPEKVSEFDISKVRFGNGSGKYFPFSRDTLKRFRRMKADTLPDYRGYYLRVNLVNILDTLRIPPHSSEIKAVPPCGSDSQTELHNQTRNLIPEPSQRKQNFKVPSLRGLMQRIEKKKTQNTKKTRWRRGLTSAKLTKKRNRANRLKTILIPMTDNNGIVEKPAVLTDNEYVEKPAVLPENDIVAQPAMLTEIESNIVAQPAMLTEIESNIVAQPPVLIEDKTATADPVLTVNGTSDDSQVLIETVVTSMEETNTAAAAAIKIAVFTTESQEEQEQRDDIDVEMASDITDGKAETEALHEEQQDCKMTDLTTTASPTENNGTATEATSEACPQTSRSFVFTPFDTKMMHPEESPKQVETEGNFEDPVDIDMGGQMSFVLKFSA